MNPKRAPDGPGETTLGDLLYADPSASPVLEVSWHQLVLAIAAADQQALRTLYEMSHRLVFTLAMRICGRRELAEEVMLDVFHDIWRRADQYNPDNGTVVGWIMIQARSRALDRLRFEQRKKRVAPELAEEPPAIVHEHARERRSSLERALSTLTADERLAIETAYFSELTYAETAAQLDEPLGTVKTRMRSALAKLRKALAKDGGQP